MGSFVVVVVVFEEAKNDNDDGDNVETVMASTMDQPPFFSKIINEKKTEEE